MRRGGSTLQYQLITDVLAASGIEFEAGWIASVDAQCLDPIAKGKWRIVKTHGIPACALDQVLNSGAIVFYISRDPRDSLVSYMRKYSIAYTETAASRFLSGIEAEFRYWTSLPITHCMIYEDLVRNAPREIERVASALGCSLEVSEIERIAKSRSIEQQKQRIEMLDWDKHGIRLGKDFIDRESLLHSNHIHGGEIGGWRSQLTKDQITSVESGFGAFIRACGYQLQTHVWQRWKFRILQRVARFTRSVLG